MNNKKFTPFSKKNVIYARLEAYIFSLILIVMVWMDKDVSAIAILLSHQKIEIMYMIILSIIFLIVI